MAKAKKTPRKKRTKAQIKALDEKNTRKSKLFKSIMNPKKKKKK